MYLPCSYRMYVAVTVNCHPVVICINVVGVSHVINSKVLNHRIQMCFLRAASQTSNARYFKTTCNRPAFFACASTCMYEVKANFILFNMCDEKCSHDGFAVLTSNNICNSHNTLYMYLYMYNLQFTCVVLIAT